MEPSASALKDGLHLSPAALAQPNAGDATDAKGPTTTTTPLPAAAGGTPAGGNKEERVLFDFAWKAKKEEYAAMCRSKKNACLTCCGLGRSFRLSSMFFLTFSYFLVEIIVGYITKSMALVADSFHMLSDVLALIIAFACLKIAKRRTRKNTFGWVRAEILGALVNAVFLLALCFSIFVEAIKRLVEPEKIEDPQLILVVGAIGLFINIIGIFLFHGHGSGHSHGGGGGGHGHSHGKGKPNDPNNVKANRSDSSEDMLLETGVVSEAHCIVASNMDGDDGSKFKVADADAAAARPLDGKKKSKASAAAQHLNMHGVFLHILGDALGSVIVVVNASIILVAQHYGADSDLTEKLIQYLDPSLSLILVLIICCTTVPLLKETALILLQTAPRDIDVHTLKESLLGLPGVQAVHEFHVWRLAGQKVIATAHIRFGELSDYLRDAEKIKALFHDYEIHSTTIQPEFSIMRSRNSLNTMSGPEVGDTQSSELASGGPISAATSPLSLPTGAVRRSRRLTEEMHGDGDCFVRCPPEACDPQAKCCGPVTAKPTTTARAKSPSDDKEAQRQPSVEQSTQPTTLVKTLDGAEVFSTPPEVRVSKPPPLAVPERTTFTREEDDTPDSPSSV